jgi:hypothetical protein
LVRGAGQWKRIDLRAIAAPPIGNTACLDRTVNRSPPVTSAQREGERAGMSDDGAQEHQQRLFGVEIGVEKIAHDVVLFVCRCPSDIGAGPKWKQAIGGQAEMRNERGALENPRKTVMVAVRASRTGCRLT